MKTYDAQVLGATGSPVLLIPGGAARSRGFFPHLERALSDHRLVLVDRQGTGTAVKLGQASLASGSAAYAEVLDALDAGPALVVAQSLGGALAVQLALDHPALVSGLVLIDPTPFNDPRTLRMLGPAAKVLMPPTALPVVGPLLERLMDGHAKLADDLARGVLTQMREDKALSWTSKALATLPAEGAALTERMRPLDVPVVLLTADRKPGHRFRVAHEEMATALGGRVVTWPGAIHAEHLRDPQQVTNLVLTVLDEVRVP